MGVTSGDIPNTKETQRAFWPQVKMPACGEWTREDCWLWLGTRIGTGSKYGGFTFRGVRCGAHAFTYLHDPSKEPIPPGHVLHNECGNKLCVNPSHWKPGDIGDRSLAAKAAARASRKPADPDALKIQKLDRLLSAMEKRLRRLGQEYRELIEQAGPVMEAVRIAAKRPAEAGMIDSTSGLADATTGTPAAFPSVGPEMPGIPEIPTIPGIPDSPKPAKRRRQGPHPIWVARAKAIGEEVATFDAPRASTPASESTHVHAPASVPTPTHVPA